MKRRREEEEEEEERSGRRGLMVMALDCGAGGREFKPRRFQNIFDLMERFDETV